MTHCLSQTSWAALSGLFNLSDSASSFIKSRGLVSFLKLTFNKYFMTTMAAAHFKGLLIQF